MIIEEISENNIEHLTKLTLELWTDCEYETEYISYKRILKSENETCYLIADQSTYFGFIHISLRFEYVEGANTSPVGYIEGIYIKPEYREFGYGKKLVKYGIVWAKEKGCSEIGSDAKLENKNSHHFHTRIGFKETNRTINYLQKIY
jgi:aminoglycoside 6'-N-acetyltransferase I